MANKFYNTIFTVRYVSYDFKFWKLAPKMGTVLVNSSNDGNAYLMYSYTTLIGIASSK